VDTAAPRGRGARHSPLSGRSALASPSHRTTR
jgi:hypothetical protein